MLVGTILVPFNRLKGTKLYAINHMVKSQHECNHLDWKSGFICIGWGRDIVLLLNIISKQNNLEMEFLNCLKFGDQLVLDRVSGHNSGISILRYSFAL